MDIEAIEERVKKRFGTYELFSVREKKKKYEVRDREIYAAEFKEEEGIALRAVEDGRLVFCATSDLGEEGIGELLKNAGMLIPFIDEDREAAFPGASPDYRTLDIFDRAGLEIDDGTKTSLLKEMEGQIRDYDRRIVATRNCELQETEVQVRVVNSEGLNVQAAKTLYTLFGLAVAKEKDEVSWYDWQWNHFLSGLDAPGLAREIAKKALSFLGSEQVETGTYPGILTPQAASDLLDVLGQSFLGENLYKNKTRLKEKTGMRCFSEKLTIVDSGMAGIDAFPFDGEGVASMESVVVKGGIFQSFLYDTYYGRKFGRPSTGNGVRSEIRTPPTCSVRGLFIKKGEGNITEGFTDGVVIHELMGTHTANPVTGDFSLGAIGYLLRGGTPIPFKGVVFAGNIFDIFGNIVEIGDDLRFYGSVGSPSLLVDGLKISGT
jgi:PmbA protein